MLRQYLDLPRAVHILCLGMFINRAGSFLIPFLTIYLTRRLGLDATVATAVIGAYGLGSILGVLVGGQLADQFGRRIVMLASLFGAAVIILLFSRLTTPLAIMVAAFTLAMVSDSYRPAASAMVADLVAPHQRSLAFGLMYVAINLGFAVAPVIGGILSEYSFLLLFVGDAATCTAYGLILLFFIRETLNVRAAAMTHLSQQAGSTTAEQGRQETVSLKQAVRSILSDRIFLIFCVATLFMAVVFMQSISTLPLHLSERGFSPRTYGWIIAINGALITCLQLPFTHVLNRFDRSRVITLAALVMGGGFGLTALAVRPWHFAATVVVWTVGEMMHAPYMQAIVSDLAPPALRARYMGVFSLSFGTAMMIGAPLGGQVLARYGAGVWMAAMGLGVISAVMYWMLRRRITAPSLPR